METEWVVEKAEALEYHKDAADLEEGEVEEQLG